MSDGWRRGDSIADAGTFPIILADDPRVSRPFNGFFDDVRLDHRLLTEDDIGPRLDLVEWYASIAPWTQGKAPSARNPACRRSARRCGRSGHDEQGSRGRAAAAAPSRRPLCYNCPLARAG